MNPSVCLKFPSRGIINKDFFLEHEMSSIHYDNSYILLEYSARRANINAIRTGHKT